MAVWPGGARGALCLSFDNLGEAAELELGALAPDDPSIGGHFTVERVLPRLLEVLGERDLAATFFVEGLNAELYPDALRMIAARGHEVAYHAWRHERWAGLSAGEQAENLARGVAAFKEIGLELTGLRPPGGALGAGGAKAVRDAGLLYCSPAGEGAAVEGGVALLPFQWQHVDASCVLPMLGAVREQMTGSTAPLDPDAFLGHLETGLDRLADVGGFATWILHPFMLDWFGESRLGVLLDRLSEAAVGGKLWVAPCMRVGEHMLAHSQSFAERAKLDPMSWTS